MELIKRFNRFKLERRLKRYGIKNYTIQPGDIIDVDGDVNLNERFKLPYGEDTILPFKFGKVTGTFECINNGLSTLNGCPNYVGKDFDCRNNNLVDLIGGPEEVGGTYYCGINQLESLEGAPFEVGGDFDCSTNCLINLNFSTNINGNLICAYNRLKLKNKPVRYKKMRTNGTRRLIDAKVFNIDQFKEFNGYAKSIVIN